MNQDPNLDTPSIEEISVNLDKLAAIQSQKNKRKFSSPISLSTLLLAATIVSLIMVIFMGGLLLSSATTAKYEVKFVQPGNASSSTESQTSSSQTPVNANTTNNASNIVTSQVKIELPLLLNYDANPSLSKTSLPSGIKKLQDITVQNQVVASLVLVPFLTDATKANEYIDLVTGQTDIVWQGAILQSPVSKKVSVQVTGTQMSITSESLTKIESKSLFYIANYIKSDLLKSIQIINYNGSEANFSRLELD